uniref:Putative RabGAP/TBC domaincontaining protein n=1 Tax=Albugo laibachii Nc14 TaxID=890382 RepID=F0WHN7_9STRA|nr:putative RabGAP/TBC domaincontaining protein [Albugo laibachii Nc14]|eukprot:CCA20730.1 putative RabGAP/TBC domaincontaining protein [Albugo laibachii Nc14]
MGGWKKSSLSGIERVDAYIDSTRMMCEAKERTMVRGHESKRVLKFPHNNLIMMSQSNACDGDDECEPLTAFYFPSITTEGEGKMYEKTQKQIREDSRQQFPGKESWVNTFVGQDALERVLIAYSMYPTSNSYIPAMAHIAGRLLSITYEGSSAHDFSENAIVCANEVEMTAFSLLKTICCEFFSDHYRGVDGLQISGLIIEDSMQKRIAALSEQLRSLGASHVGFMIARNWFLPLFCTDFPPETTCRILDIIMAEGPDVIFAIAIAILRMNQAAMMDKKIKYHEIFALLKKGTNELMDVEAFVAIVDEEWVALRDKLPRIRTRCMKKFHNREAKKYQDLVKSML